MHRIVPIAFLCSCLVACGAKSVPLESGPYTLIRDLDNEEMASDPSVTLTIDLEAGTATFVDAGAMQSVGLERIDDADWVEQCPTQRGAQLLEWVRIDGPLTVDGVTFDAPVIIAGCHTGGFWFVDGETVPNDRAVQVGEEAWLVDLAYDEQLPDPLLFLPNDLL